MKGRDLSVVIRYDIDRPQDIWETSTTLTLAREHGHVDRIAT
jgi:hypothetical protein